MNVGKKIRELRVAKLMTQVDLAGTKITRNMLSCIENGSAQPSLSTILYIAERLNVPVGFLLAEEGDEVIYQKITVLPNIKKAYASEDWRGCRSLCLSACRAPDDEIALLLAKCDAEIAVEEFRAGRLHSSCRYFDEAMLYATKTIYPTSALFAKAGVYFRMMQRVSPTLYSDVYEDAACGEYAWESPFVYYVRALEALDDGSPEKAKELLTRLPQDSFYAEHIHIRLMMGEGRFSEAHDALSQLLERGTLPDEVALYSVLSELEICCKETDDFKGAYKYSNERLQQLEHLLREI